MSLNYSTRYNRKIRATVILLDSLSFDKILRIDSISHTVPCSLTSVDEPSMLVSLQSAFATLIPVVKNIQCCRFLANRLLKLNPRELKK